MTALVREASRSAETDASDSRFTFGLIYDVFTLLESHGYQRADDRHTGLAVGLLLRLARAYEGTGEDAAVPL
jgi:hypothetical protein